MKARRRLDSPRRDCAALPRQGAGQPCVFRIDPTSLPAIRDAEATFGTTRLLPPAEEIPEAFWRGNVYSRAAGCGFQGTAAPQAEVQLREGLSVPDFLRLIDAHLRSFEPGHAHMIAGVGYLMSMLCTLTAVDKQPAGGRGHG